MTTIDNNELPRPGIAATTSGQGLLSLTRGGTGAVRGRTAPARPAAGPRRGDRTGVGLPAALLAVDAAAVFAAVAAAGHCGPLGALWAACGLFPVLALFNSSGGLYRTRLVLSVLDELPGLCGRAAVAAAIALTLEHCLPGQWPCAFPDGGRPLLALLLCQLALDLPGGPPSTRCCAGPGGAAPGRR
ncbi:hypothetical protein GXW82_42165 [Streptacidiphilus sp. 4-A2]|nr:hypothetical protein [Streptacidiphilus sp. 4-A2]